MKGTSTSCRGAQECRGRFLSLLQHRGSLIFHCLSGADVCRAAHECRVRFHGHNAASVAADAGRALTADEEATLANAVAQLGTRNWAAVGAAAGLPGWPPWRLLQAWRRLEARAVTTEAWDPARDEELVDAAQRLMRSTAMGRQVSWLVRLLLVFC